MTITTKPNLHLPLEELQPCKVDGVVMLGDVQVLDGLWGSCERLMEWEEQYRKETGDWDVYKETGRLVHEWLKNIGLEGKVYFYSEEKVDFSVYRGARQAIEKGYEYCIAENLS